MRSDKQGKTQYILHCSNTILVQTRTSYIVQTQYLFKHNTCSNTYIQHCSNTIHPMLFKHNTCSNPIHNIVQTQYIIHCSNTTLITLFKHNTCSKTIHNIVQTQHFLHFPKTQEQHSLHLLTQHCIPYVLKTQVYLITVNTKFNLHLTFQEHTRPSIKTVLSKVHKLSSSLLSTVHKIQFPILIYSHKVQFSIVIYSSQDSVLHCYLQSQSTVLHCYLQFTRFSSPLLSTVTKYSSPLLSTVHKIQFSIVIYSHKVQFSIVIYSSQDSVLHCYLQFTSSVLHCYQQFTSRSSTIIKVYESDLHTITENIPSAVSSSSRSRMAPYKGAHRGRERAEAGDGLSPPGQVIRQVQPDNMGWLHKVRVNSKKKSTSALDDAYRGLRNYLPNIHHTGKATIIEILKAATQHVVFLTIHLREARDMVRMRDALRPPPWPPNLDQEVRLLQTGGQRVGADVGQLSQDRGGLETCAQTTPLDVEVQWVGDGPQESKGAMKVQSARWTLDVPNRLPPVNSTAVLRQKDGQPLQCPVARQPASLQSSPQVWRPFHIHPQQLPLQPQARPWLPSQEESTRIWTGLPNSSAVTITPITTTPIQIWSVPATPSAVEAWPMYSDPPEVTIIPVTTTSRPSGSPTPRKGGLQVARWLTDPSYTEQGNTPVVSPTESGWHRMSRDSEPTRTFNVWPYVKTANETHHDTSVHSVDGGQGAEHWKTVIRELQEKGDLQVKKTQDKQEFSRLKELLMDRAVLLRVDGPSHDGQLMNIRSSHDRLSMDEESSPAQDDSQSMYERFNQLHE